MALPFYNWSRTAASNATADATVNWAEGQAPSSVNDSARAMMASTAAYRDDISGAIVTGGTSTAYTVTSYEVFDTLAHMANQMIAFTPHTTNGATVTLNVDGLGAKPLRSAPSTELLAGTLIQGTPYVATYNNSDAVWYLQSFYGNPYNIPLGAGMPFFLPTAPNSAFVFPFGQAISRTTYSALFAQMSTLYGSGDGSTTFNVPDLRGRIPAGKDDMGGSSAFRITNAVAGFAGDTLGGAGGSQSHTLSLAELPTGITSSGNNSISVSGPSSGAILANGIAGTLVQVSINSGVTRNYNETNAAAFSGANTITATSNNTSGSAHAIVQPTIVCNYIIRII
jgi:microcystin-dependent protein